MSNLKQKLQSVEDKTRAARAKQKTVLRAVQHVRVLDKELEKMRNRAPEVNVEFALEGDILLDFDLADYPELAEDVFALCERLAAAALERVDGAT